MTSKPRIVYFSNVTNNTHRFVEKLGYPATRIPLRAYKGEQIIDEPYILILPTYGDGAPNRLIPKQVGKFLNNKENRKHIRGVIVSGNANFGEDFGAAGNIVADKCRVPLLYRFEVAGTPEDVAAVKKGLEEFWRH